MPDGSALGPGDEVTHLADRGRQHLRVGTVTTLVDAENHVWVSWPDEATARRHPVPNLVKVGS